MPGRCRWQWRWHHNRFVHRYQLRLRARGRLGACRGCGECLPRWHRLRDAQPLHLLGLQRGRHSCPQWACVVLMRPPVLGRPNRTPRQQRICHWRPARGRNEQPWLSALHQRSLLCPAGKHRRKRVDSRRETKTGSRSRGVTWAVAVMTSAVREASGISTTAQGRYVHSAYLRHHIINIELDLRSAWCVV